jgi:hypothetical protein
MEVKIYAYFSPASFTTAIASNSRVTRVKSAYPTFFLLKKKGLHNRPLLFEIQPSKSAT